MKAPFVTAILLTAVLGLVAFFIYIAFIEPQLDLSHRRMTNKRMAELRDRVKSNPTDPRALSSMIDALHSRSSFERTAAAAYLGQVGSAAAPAVDALTEALNGTDLFVAREAAQSLGKIGPGARRSVPALISAVEQHPDADIGWFAAKSLGYVADPNDASVASVLERAERSSDDRMRRNAKEGLETLKSRRSEYGN